MICKLRGMRFRRCRGRQVHLGFGLLGLAAKTDAEADLLQLPRDGTLWPLAVGIACPHAPQSRPCGETLKGGWCTSTFLSCACSKVCDTEK